MVLLDSVLGVQMLHTGCSHIWLGTLNADGVSVRAPLEQEISGVSKYGLLVVVMRQVVIQVINDQQETMAACI